MFFLIENNKIIKESNKVCVEFFGENEYLKFKKNNQYFKIKKQSNNIFDLIESGDLVRFEFGGMMMIDTYHTSRMSYYQNFIIAIYKMNKKEDYIKVWQKKEEI